MRRIQAFLPSIEGIGRNKAKIGGFAAGVLVPVAAILLFQAFWTGQGLWQEARVDAPLVYPTD